VKVISSRRVAALLALSLIAAACAGSSSEDPADTAQSDQDQASGDSDEDAGEEQAAEPAAVPSADPLVVGVPEDLDSTDPHAAVGETASIWLHLVYESLVGIDQDANPVPGLATSWEFNDAGDVVTFSLRDDVTFHDGSPFTSEAVKFSYERLQDPDVGGTSQAAFVVESMETPDDYTIVFNLTQPSGSFLADAAQPGKSAIISPTAVGADGSIEDPIGTGPFVFESYTVNDRLELRAHEAYWGGSPSLSGIDVRIIPDDNTRVNALASGEIQMGWNVRYEVADPRADEGGFELQELPQNRGNWIALNSQRAPFDDVRVREALFLAISRSDIADVAWDGRAAPTLQPFTEESQWYIDLDLRTASDLERAGALLDEAGVSGGPITILQWDALGSDLETQLIASAWGELGFDVSIELVDIGTLTSTAYGDGDFDAVSLWIGLNLDPNRPYSFFDSEGGRQAIVGNYADEELDRLVRDARAVTDVEQRRALYEQILSDYVVGESLQFYTVRPFQYVGVSDRVQDYVQGTSYAFYDGGGMLVAKLVE